MDRRDFMSLSLLASGISIVSPAALAFDFGKALEAGKNLLEAESLTDEQLKSYCNQMAKDMDSKNKVAAPNTPYGQRLVRLTKGLDNYAGQSLNFKVYQTKDINAFAMADGTIRVYSGLMDEFSDDEIRYVIGHEMGHIQAGHSKARIQTALRTSALKNAVSASGGKAAQLADSQLGALFEAAILAQHSQGNEREADDNSMKFMKARKYNQKACVTALEKLDALSGGSSGVVWLSTHPSPKERAERMRSQLDA